MRKVVKLLVLGVLVSGCADGGGGITVGTHLDNEFGAGETGPTAPGDVTADPLADDPLADGYAQWWVGLSGPADLTGAPASPGRPRFLVLSAVLTLPQPTGLAARVADLRLGDWIDQPTPLTAPADAPLVLAASEAAPIVVEIVGLLDDGRRQWTTPLVLQIVAPLTVHSEPIAANRRQLLLNEPALQGVLAQPLHACALATAVPDDSTLGNPKGGSTGSNSSDSYDATHPDPRGRDADAGSAIAGAPAAESGPKNPNFAPSSSEHPACIKAQGDAASLIFESSSWMIVGLPDAP